MWVKICATTNLEDALLAVEAGADAVGFVFAASKRQVTAEQVAAITAHLPAGVSKVGVFTATDAAEILAQAGMAGLDVVQLHSVFNAGLIEAVAGAGLRALQVIDVPAEAGADEIRASLVEALQHPQVYAVLLDASHGGHSGGTGKTFDWERMAGAVREAESATGGRVVIAGGLRPENVGLAIVRFEPWGVDVASGVEAVPGKKDPSRVKAFISAARGVVP